MNSSIEISKPSLKELQNNLKNKNQDETQYVEFKTTLRYDLKEEKKNKKLEEVAIKTIAAFNNSMGGYLIFGVTVCCISNSDKNPKKNRVTLSAS